MLDPAVSELGEVVWVVDLNRQSLDRVVPGIAAEKLQGMFTAAGWQVITLKYGRQLEELFARPGGEALRQRIDAMPNGRLPGGRRVCHQPRSPVPGGARKAEPRTGRVLGAGSGLPGRARHTSGHRPRRPSARPGLSGRHRPRARLLPRRDPVRTVRRTRGRLPPSRPRCGQRHSCRT
ncbi:hypothetical protein OHB22_46715 [Streptomyces canus]